MREFVIDAIRSMGVLGVALLMFLENLFPPLPSEFIMPLAGYLAAREEFSIWAALVAGTAGSLLGAVVWYVVGRRVSRDRLRRWLDRHGIWIALCAEDADKAERFFKRHGRAGVLFGRLVPVVRTLISVPAGTSRMPSAPFVLFSFLGTAVWTTALGIAGLVLGQRFPEVQKYLGVATWVILGLAAVSYAYRVTKIRRARG